MVPIIHNNNNNNNVFDKSKGSYVFSFIILINVVYLISLQ